MINIVLYRPEIFPNTANIIRTCFALKAKLHIVKPVAFDLHPHWLKRAAAGLFLSDIEHEIHENYTKFEKMYGKKDIFFLTRYSKQVYTQVDFKKILQTKKELFLVFGSESTGIRKDILQKNLDRCLRIPMNSKSRSLNLSNSVAVVGYEVLRQLNFADLSFTETQKGPDFLEK